MEKNQNKIKVVKTGHHVSIHSEQSTSPSLNHNQFVPILIPPCGW